MDFLINLYNTLDTQLESTPTSYGLYHILCLVGVAVLTVLVCRLFKDSSDRAVNVLTAVIWVVILILEMYKQALHVFHIADGAFYVDYSWYVFPFQFCSSPLYILPIIAFTKSEKLRDECIAYMMTFSLFAGLAVMLYPGDVFTPTAGICIQTMVHHGSQVLIGIFYAIRYRDRFGVKHFFGGVKVFSVMSIIAIVLNVVVYRAFVFYGIDKTFNMFYISPYFDCTLPILSTVYKMIPYGAFLCVYLFGFVLAALIVYSIFKGLLRDVRSTQSLKPHEKVYMSKSKKTLVFANEK